MTAILVTATAQVCFVAIGRQPIINVTDPSIPRSGCAACTSTGNGEIVGPSGVPREGINTGANGNRERVCSVAVSRQIATLKPFINKTKTLSIYKGQHQTQV